MLVDRRNFLKSMGIVSGTAVMSCNRMAPEEKLSAYLTPPVEMVPGVAAYYATVCRACSAGCGILVKTREARPIKLEGNPAHPVNRGALCARGQAFIQSLYSRARIKTPLMRQDGQLVAVGWSKALKAVARQMKGADTLGLLTGAQSGSFKSLINDINDNLAPIQHVMTEPVALSSMAAAAKALFGVHRVPRIDLSGVDQLISLGADLLDTFVSPVELSRQWAERHGVAAGRQLQLDYVGSRRNLTATAADRWYCRGAGDVEQLAVGLLHRVFQSKRPTLSAAVARAVNAAIDKLGPAPKLESDTQKVQTELTSRLLAAKSGLVLFGGAEVLGAQATAVQAAVLLTNYLIGAIGPALKFEPNHILSNINSEQEVLDLLEASAQGTAEVLFIHQANPVYTLPQAAGITTALAKTKMVVALASEMDETAALADVVLPVHHPLESWGDYELTDGIAGLMQPVRAPLYDSKHVGDLLIELVAHAGTKLSHKRFKDYLVRHWSKWSVQPGYQASVPSLPAPGDPPDGGPEPAAPAPTKVERPTELSDREWEEMLVRGGRFLDAGGPQLTKMKLYANAELPRFAARPAKGSVELIVPLSPSLYDGRGAPLDWLREVPDSLLQTAWEIPAEIATDVARANGLTTGDRAELKSASGQVQVKVIIDDDLAPGTVALRPGGGREVSRHTEDTANPMALLGGKTDPTSGELSRRETITLSRIDSGELTSVMGHPNSEGRLLALSMNLDDFNRGQYPIITRHGQVEPAEHPHEHKDGADHHHPQPVPMPHDDEKNRGKPLKDNVYPLQDLPDHRWGMVIDLDKCTGCGACAVACYAENNVPVVGKAEIQLGRELSWLRIEKHVFSGDGTSRVQFLPVMCQQCDNAPCEAVCPAFAASHTRDGLNAQIYNRCIGTRYCSNNCPYKVRRFNYFDYTREKPANQQLNPDVTVRTRGVMEKCTFCIQRIREAQNRHQVDKTPLEDGEITTACAQTCPTGAISFGDFKRPEWAMSKLAKDPRGYRLLDYMVNTRPGVVYLRRVNTVSKQNKGNR